MKKILLTSLVIAVAVSGLFAQTKKEKDEMVFEKTVDGETRHDFGSIVYGADGSVDFVFTNEGTKPLVITNVAATCGCTVPTWPKEPIEPGKKGSVKVVYNTKLVGTFNKTIVVYSNANNSPVRISVLGKVNAKPADIQSGGKSTQTLTNDEIRQAELDAAAGLSGSLNTGNALPPAKQKKKELYESEARGAGSAANTESKKETSATRIK
ncbi:MAG: DUF1573 domain-containing protein [Bacteroidales bacterium]